MTRVESEYLRLKRYIPVFVRSVLDVGCGAGGMDVQLGLHNGTRIFHLLDGDASDLGPKRMSYNEAGKPWRSTDKAVVALANILPDATVTTYTPDDEWPPRVDLVMSLWSWGFHYPIETYLTQLERVKAPLVIDLRRKVYHQSIHALSEIGYSLSNTIDQDHKAIRVFMRP